MSRCDVAIIGAGPYGLSIAAHLRAAGVDFRIFGNPMEFWLKHMPKGMHLKSEGFASSLYDPESKFTLKDYCRERQIPYAHTGSPVPLEVFAAYGLEFQKRFVPDLERKRVTSVHRLPSGFRLSLEDGVTLAARRVVVAVGLTYYAYVPPELTSLPPELVSHSSQHNSLEKFSGRQVAIVGAGASAIDLAALLHQAGAIVEVISRGPQIRFQTPPGPVAPGWIERINNPLTGIGLGWKLYACANLPLVFRRMPERFRIEKVREVLGPAPCWFTKEQVVGKVGFTLGVTVDRASVEDGRIALQLTDRSGNRKESVADHVIAATGYTYNLRKMSFLDPGIVSTLHLVGDSPALSSHFESSIPNLFFVGVTAANTFGPLLRFAFGAGFAAPRLARHLARTANRAWADPGMAAGSSSAREPRAAAPMAQ